MFPEEVSEGLVAGAGADDRLSERFQRSTQCEEACVAVVDDEDRRDDIRRADSSTIANVSGQRVNQSPTTRSRSSMSTGLVM